MRGRAPAVALAASLGAFVGFSSVAFVHSGAAQYLSDDPAACARCHVMEEHFRAWTRSSHGHVASCHDCHARRDAVGSIVDRTSRGLRHSAAMLLGADEPAYSSASSRATIDAACRSCHAQMVGAIIASDGTLRDRPCVSCHGSVGHLGAAGGLRADGTR